MAIAKRCKHERECKGQLSYYSPLCTSSSFLERVCLGRVHQRCAVWQPRCQWVCFLKSPKFPCPYQVCGGLLRVLFYYLMPPTNMVRGTGQIKLICRILSRRFQINTSLTDGVMWINGIAGDASGSSQSSLSLLKMMPVIGYTKRPALCYSDVAKF